MATHLLMEPRIGRDDRILLLNRQREHLLREPAGHRVRSRPAKRSPRIVRGMPPAISIALRQSQMDIFDFISLFPWQKPRSYSTRPDSTAGWGSSATSLYRYPLSLAPYDSRSVLAVKGPLAPLRALDRSGETRCLRGKGRVLGRVLPGRNGSFGHISALSRSGGAKSPAGP